MKKAEKRQTTARKEKEINIILCFFLDINRTKNNNNNSNYTTSKYNKTRTMYCGNGSDIRFESRKNQIFSNKINTENK